MKQGLVLDRVVLLGRTFEEYVRFFSLQPPDLAGRRIVDIASGVSSFCAEAAEQDLNATGCDLIYELDPAQIQERCENDLDLITQSIGKLPVYRWDFYQTPEQMRRFRQKAYRLFLADYTNHRGTRYVPGKLPSLPFRDGQFDLALVSYLLFVYEDQLSYEFHRNSILEIMRVTADEARIYPIVTFEAQSSDYLPRLRADARLKQFEFQVHQTDFEFLRNSNQVLIVRRAAR